MTQRTLTAAAFFMLGAVASAHDGNIAPGSDVLVSPPGASSYAPTLPAGFFGAGSALFNGLIIFDGLPLVGTGLPAGIDTIIKRPEVVIMRLCPDTQTTPIQLLALSLTSQSPITISFGAGGNSTYNVVASASSVVPQGLGSMVLSRTSLDGGTFNSTMPVDLRLVFTKAGGASGLASIVLDPAPQFVLTATGGAWCYNPAPGAPTSTGGTVNHDVNGATPVVNYAGTTAFYLATQPIGATCQSPGSAPPQSVPIYKQCPSGQHGFFTAPPGPVGTPFCFGDGLTGGPCPCGNFGAPGNGCATTGLPGGANLFATGNPGASAGTDTLVLTATGPLGPALFIQSNGTSSGFFLGDGILCASVGIVRLGVVFAVGGVASYPGGLTPAPIHIAGSTSAGQTKHYQVWFRSTPALCQPGVANYDLTQGLSVLWGP